MKKSGMPDRVESLREVNRSKNRPNSWLRFVKLIRDGLRKIKNLIESRPFRAKTGLAGRENELKIPQRRVDEIE